MEEQYDFEAVKMELFHRIQWADQTDRSTDVLQAHLRCGAALCAALQRDLKETRHIKTDEMERDPVSGNLRPKFRFERVKAADHDLHMEIRLNLRDLLVAMVAAFKHLSSPAYPEARAVLVRWEAHLGTSGWTSALEGTDAAELVGNVSRLILELTADTQVAVHESEVANG